MGLDFAHVKPDLINFFILSVMVIVIITFWKFVAAQSWFPKDLATLIQAT